jgi:hypothetical protein
MLVIRLSWPVRRGQSQSGRDCVGNSSKLASAKRAGGVFVVLTDPDDFRIRNHDFSASAANYPVLVIEAVQNVKVTVFQQLPGVDLYFVTFL